MSTQPEAYPLYWPAGRPRTPRYRREWGRFKITPGRARDSLFEELQRMGARYIVLSTNMELRRDGLPYANRRTPDDPGVAVYFQYKDQQFTFACDRYDEIHKNIRAIAKTIEALRGIERWGTGEMVKQAFAGFAALPAPDQKKPWWEVLGVSRETNWEWIKSQHKYLAQLNHPDKGGDHDRMAEINTAFDEAKMERARG